MNDKRLAIVFLISLLLVPAISIASWKADAWDVFKGSVSAAAGNILSSFVNPTVASENSNKLDITVSNLEKKLREFDVDGQRPDNFLQVQHTIVGMRNMVSILDQRVTTLEDKVKDLEDRLSVMKNNESTISYLLPKNEVETMLRKVRPSFECSKAREDIELSICQSLILRDIDGRMGRLYWELRSYFSQSISRQLLDEQLLWLKRRDAVCHPYDQNCLVNIYKERITELKSKF